MKKALITGANKGIGLETARQLLQKGYYAYLGSRNLENGLEAAAKLKSDGLNEVEAVQIDVSDSESVKAAREAIGRKSDVLIWKQSQDGQKIWKTITRILINTLPSNIDWKIFADILMAAKIYE